jgi:hypothetical protein
VRLARVLDRLDNQGGKDDATDSIFKPLTPPLKLSFSALRAFEMCPRCFYLSKVLGVDPPESNEIRIGNIAHGTLEKFYRRWRDADAEGGPKPGLTELLRIARTLSASATLPRLAEPVLATLADATGESAYLAEAVDARTAVYVAMESGRHSVRHVSWLGHTITRRGSALGRALIGDVDGDGVAVLVDAVEDGITAVSAPVYDASGQIAAAISVVGPSFRLRSVALTAARKAVSAHAADLSIRAGYRDA